MENRAEGISFGRLGARRAAHGIWLGPEQTAVLRHLEGPAALKVLVGPPSSGKSTVLRHFHTHAIESVVLSVRGPQKSSAGVLQALLNAADLGAHSLSSIEQRNLLTVFVEQRNAQGRRVVVCADDVCKFSAEAWSEIDRLRLVQVAGKPLIDLVVVATEADMSRAPLERLLRDSDTSTIEAAHFMDAPTDKDIADYIGWRLAQRGLRTKFSEDACQAILRLCGGRFDIINALFEAVLSGPASACPPSIHGGMVARAAAELVALRAARESSEEIDAGDQETEGPVIRAATHARLHVAKNGKLVRTVVLQPRLFIGRGDHNELRLESRYLSRHHAAIIQGADGRYLVTDLNSTNGLMVNGKTVRRHVLRSGDVVRLCEYYIKVELSSENRIPQTSDRSATADERDTDIMPVPQVEAPSMRLIKH